MFWAKYLLNLTIFFSFNWRRRIKSFIFLSIILLQATTGCNPEKISTTPTSILTIYFKTENTMSPTISQTKSPTISPTRFLTITNVSSPTATIDYSHTIERHVYLTYTIDAEDNPKSYLDLDTMEIGNTPQSDLQFSVSRGEITIGITDPLNGARSKGMGKGNIKLTDCLVDLNLYSEHSSADTYKGSHICFISNKNQFFLLWIDNIIQQTYDAFTMSLLITAHN